MLTRRPREVYRVYAEDELLGAEEDDGRRVEEAPTEELESAAPTAGAADRDATRRDRRLGLPLLAALIGVLAGVVVVTLIAEDHSAPTPPARYPRSATSVNSSNPAVLNGTHATSTAVRSSHARQQQRRRARSTISLSRREAAAAPSTAVRRGAPASAEHAPSPASDVTVAATEPPPPPTASRATDAGGEAAIEFGFER